MGCYKNYDHAQLNDIRQRSTSQVSLHEVEEVPPYSPQKQQQQRTSAMEMYHDGATNEEKRLLTQDETPTHVPTQMMVTPAEVAELRRQIALEQHAQHKKDKQIDSDMPTEFECCFCTSKDFKDFTDAEGLTCLPTSDFRRPMTLEMRNITNGGAINQLCHQSSPSNGLSTITLPLETPLRSHNAQNPGNSYNGDLASLNSSDTYASCQTHPFLSQGDLTADMADAVSALDDLDMNNLYINPLEKDSDDLRTQVKKSASGDTALCNIGGTSLDESFQNFQSFEERDRGSRVSLNETPVPKHRKTRFQQSVTKPKARFEVTKTSQESLNEGKKNRRSSFMPAKSLASATKLINQHLFGIQSISAKGKTENKLSLSIDSIDSQPNQESHRRSKSILKNKSEASKILTDPESERLLADNMSGAGISDISGDASSDYSPNKLPMAVNKSISPPLNQRHRILIQQRSVPAGLSCSKPVKFQLPRYPEEQVSRQAKPVLHKTAATGVDHLTGDERMESVTRDSSIESETAFCTYRSDYKDQRGSSEYQFGSSDERKSLINRGNSNESSGTGCGSTS